MPFFTFSQRRYVARLLSVYTFVPAFGTKLSDSELVSTPAPRELILVWRGLITERRQPIWPEKPSTNARSATG